MSRRVYTTDEISEFETTADGSSPDEVIDIQGDQFDGEDQADADLLNLKSYDLWALGLTTAIGGHFFAWSSGLTRGFGTFIIATFIISAAYYCLILCMAELSSALPFAGGVYGMARVTLGVYPGFLVAVLDSYKSILATSSGAYLVGKMMIVITQGDEKMQFLYWILFYIYCLTINGYGGRAFWRINKVSMAISATLLLMYLFGSMKFADFGANAPLSDEHGTAKWFDGGMHAFMLILPQPSRFFVGIQSIQLACGQIKNPKKEVPKAYRWCVHTVLVTCFVLVFLACSLPPGTKRLALQSHPLTPGFAQMFDILPRYALILTLPVTVFYGSTYMFYFGQQLRAMGNSGLIHPIFGYDSYRNTPVLAHLGGALVGYAVCVTEFYFEDVRRQLSNLNMLGAMATYISILISYIMFHNYFSSIKREFVSPLGNYGAVYGIIIFVMVIISIAGFQPDHNAVIAFVVILAAASLYYYFVVIKRQVFSEEEKKVLFTAYLVKNNRSKAQRIRKGTHTRHRYGHTSPTSVRPDDSGIILSDGKRDDNSVSIHRSLESLQGAAASPSNKNEVHGVELERGRAGTSVDTGSTSAVANGVIENKGKDPESGLVDDRVASKDEPRSATIRL